MSGRPALSEDGGGGGAAARALDTSVGEPRLNTRPGGVSSVTDDVSGSHVGPRTVKRGRLARVVACQHRKTHRLAWQAPPRQQPAPPPHR